MHARRIAYYVEKSEPNPILKEPAFLSSAGGGCPMSGTESTNGELKCSPIRFGRMFRPMWGDAEPNLDEQMKFVPSLVKLGTCMNNPETCHQGINVDQAASDIPAGYTYLGQFITHEITFDNAKDLPVIELKPENVRSPSLDLDSLYGPGPKRRKELYEAERPARLKVGLTQDPPGSFNAVFDNDLPRREKGEQKSVAIIGDERNDEVLPLAQTHVAFIKFHNKVVEDIEKGLYKKGRPTEFAPPPAERLFETAKAEVIRHFHWLILKDFLPRLIDPEMLTELIRNPRWDGFENGKSLFIPLEFSAAAFRIGHSMVRRNYHWNRRHKNVPLHQLFTHTKRSGNLNGLETLDSSWVIDWKFFYDFTPFAADYPHPYEPPQKPTMAGQIDTIFHLRLDELDGFNHNGLPLEKRSITVRNLLRGLALGLPWGEDVAEMMGEQPLKPDELRGVPHSELLDAAPLGGKTPLWFYVLRESAVQQKGFKLGRVGGRIVAETLVGLIRHSRYSILRKTGAKEPEWGYSDWRPAYGREVAEPERMTFEMVDLLRAADVVDPVGRKAYLAEHPLS
jgi:heme peroxidase